MRRRATGMPARERGFLVAADGVGVEAELRARQDQVGDDQQHQHEDHDEGKHPGQVAQVRLDEAGRGRQKRPACIRVVVEQVAVAEEAEALDVDGHRHAAREQETDAAGDAEHAQRGDEGRHVEPGDEDAVDQARDPGSNQARPPRRSARSARAASSREMRS